MTKLKKVLLYLIGLYFAQIFIQHGWMKFDPEGFWSGAFVKRWGYGLAFMYFIGVLEFIGGLVLLIPLPKVSRYGAFVLCLVMIGALITRIVFGTSINDVISISFNALALFYISIQNGIQEDFQRLKLKRQRTA